MENQIYKNNEAVEKFYQMAGELQKYVSKHVDELSKDDEFAFFLISSVKDGEETYSTTDMVAGKFGTMIRRMVEYMMKNQEIAQVIAYSLDTYLKVVEEKEPFNVKLS